MKTSLSVNKMNILTEILDEKETKTNDGFELELEELLGKNNIIFSESSQEFEDVFEELLKEYKIIPENDFDQLNLFLNSSRKKTSNKQKPPYRLLEVKPIGNTGNKVLVRYYDTKKYELQEIESNWVYITPTIEVLPEKYGLSPQGLIDVLSKEFPKGRFIIKRYGSKKLTKEQKKLFENTDLNDRKFVELPTEYGLKEKLEKDKEEKRQQFGDIEQYLPNERSIIIWHLGSREDKKYLEYFLDKKKNKQIFIKNSPKRFTARTNLMNQETLETTLENLKQSLRIPKEDIERKKNYIQVKLEEKDLEKLRYKNYFRIFEYISKPFNTEKQAEAHLEETRKIKTIKTNTDKIRIIKIREEKSTKIKFYAKINASKNDEETLFNLKALGYKENKDEYRKIKINGELVKLQKLSTRELKWDPLDENTTAGQLRDFFPAHMIYYPTISATAQANSKIQPFTHIEHGNSDLEDAVKDAYEFYKKNTAIIDLETIDWVADEIPSGRVYMAVLRSETQNNLYVSKEVWANDKLRKQVEEKYKNIDGEIIFSEDEIELISQLNQDAKKYEYIIGHNYHAYDHVHLTKFNYESKLFKKGEIDEKTKERIKEVRKKNGDDRLWTHKKEKSMDSYKYLRTRIDLLKNHKLSTFAGFKKSIDYFEMDELIKKKTLEDLSKVIDYTFEDGLKTKELMDKLLYNSVLEGFAINEDLPGVFGKNPLMNFYDSGKRDYFMKMNTHRNRHERSYHRHIDKLLARDSPEEILEEKIKKQPQKIGMHEGELIAPIIWLNVFEEYINNRPVLRLIKERVHQETNPILKADLVSKLSAAVHVMADKAKNWIESAGLIFGERYDAKDVYEFLHETDKTKAEHIFRTTNDFELNRTSWIYGIEYGLKREKSDYFDLPVEKTILEINNRFADELEKFRENDFIGRTKNYFFSNGDIPGIKIGNMKGINLGGGTSAHKIIGKLRDNEYLYEFYGNTAAPKNKIVQNIVDRVVFEENDLDEIDVEYMFRLKDKEKKTYGSLVESLTGINPSKLKTKREISFAVNNFKPGTFNKKYVPRGKAHNSDQIGLF